MLAPREEHSRKPEGVRAFIERVSYGPYVELFARTSPNGWDAWGNEVESDIVLTTKPKGGVSNGD